MIVEVAKIQNSGVNFDLKFEPSEIDLESELAEVSGETLFEGKVLYTDLRTIVSGGIETQVKLNCVRCLKEILQKLKITVENAYILAEDYTKQEEYELEKEGLEISIFEGGEIDLKKIAGEQIALALPSQIVCENSCKGLCEKCGANLNSTDCKCKENEIDPRWSALKKLKIKN